MSTTARAPAVADLKAASAAATSPLAATMLASRSGLSLRTAAAGSTIWEMVRMCRRASRTHCTIAGSATLRVLAKQVVVDDDPAGVVIRRNGCADHLDPRRWIDHADLAPPIQLERSRADYEDGSLRRGDLHGGNRLSRLAEAHVVAKDSSSLGDKKRDPIGLMGIQETRRQTPNAIEVRDRNGAHDFSLRCTLCSDVCAKC
jgi:hypothetical protein